MNRAVPPGDCGNRNRTARRQPRRAGTLSCGIGLVGRIEAHSERAWPLSLGSLQEKR
jgi:hypothetical protein